MTPTQPVPQPGDVMMQMIFNFWTTRALYAAAKLGLADLVKDGPQTAAQLAAATGTHAPSLYRLLRALASVGVFAEDEQGRFAQTPLSDMLRTDAPVSLRWTALVELGQEHFVAWSNLLHSLETGGIAFEDHYKMNCWEYYAQNPEHAQNFNNSMTGFTALVNQALLAAYDFSGINTLVDVAGSLGALLAAVLPRYPHMRGVLFDQPHVIADAGPLLEAANVRARCEIAGGDFFQAVPAGGDAYFLKFIIHDWDDERALAILQTVQRAMPAHGKLLLGEMVVPPGNEPSMSKFLDLNMLVMLGGRERTAEQFRDLFQRAGFRLTRIVPTHSPMCVIEGEKVS
ncbi:MAG: methyltransferase [Acidobacteria bacterium]|nr:methyltransferase [Acidobacteriota bacterium]MBI3422334.1 methyltransferase [Acidobacteriota bacterium]